MKKLNNILAVAIAVLTLNSVANAQDVQEKPLCTIKLYAQEPQADIGTPKQDITYIAKLKNGKVLTENCPTPGAATDQIRSDWLEVFQGVLQTLELDPDAKPHVVIYDNL